VTFRSRAAIAAFALAATACGSPGTGRFVATTAPTLALSHVRIIDGTGAPAVEDQTLIVENGRITSVGDAARIKVPAGARVVDLRGRTVFPGLVGMHEHLFYQYGPPDGSSRLARAEHAFAKLYLASGVTTIRTAGAADLAADVRLKRAIDDDREPGPKIHLTGTYLNAAGEDPDPAAIVRQIDADAELGATSFKAYQTLRAPELRAAIQAAHAHGLRITGHLCAVGYREAAQMGIDNIEHGLLMDSDFYPDKRPDLCPNQYEVFDQLDRMDDSDAAIRGAITDLVRHGVAVTSTLAIIETFTSREFAFDPRTLDVLVPGLQDVYRQSRAHWIDRNNRGTQMWTAMLRKEMAFERAFAAAGGRLMAGADPTGWGGIVAGFADERELELLVEAGFTAEQAIKVASANGAAFLFESNDIGTIAPGKRADLVVVRGNPSVHIGDVRNVERVFKDGVGYDPGALIAGAAGGVHQYDFWHILYSPGDMVLIVVVGALLVAVVVKRTRGFRRAAAVGRARPQAEASRL
jgi:imidazolonepropionase-like amidohydrolase